MFFLFGQKNDVKNENLFQKEFFNAIFQEKNIKQAALQSAEDQKKLMQEYQKMLQVNSPS